MTGEENDTGAEGRAELATEVRGSKDRLVELCRQLIQIDSQNPPGDTETIASFVERWIGDRPDIDVRRMVGKSPVINLLVRMSMKAQGRRLVLNGHLDTFPVGDVQAWTVPPLEGLVQDGRLYGRGVSDMKAGVAVALLTAELIWKRRDQLAGELVLTLVGDEETGGTWGTKYLLDNVPEASGDAMLNGDAGSPKVARFGEKGQMWVRLEARGRPAHGAHVHLGDNAIESLMEGLRRAKTLEGGDTAIPSSIASAMDTAAPVSESVSGQGETEVLRAITVNIGTIHGGTAVNMVPGRAQAEIDIRFPPGLTADTIWERLQSALAGTSIAATLLSRCEPNWTDPHHEVVQLTVRNSAEVLDKPAVANMRVGFSDARYYRHHQIPSVVYGPTPHNMGGPDEFVTLSDLEAVLYVHVLTAYDYLAR